MGSPNFDLHHFKDSQKTVRIHRNFYQDAKRLRGYFEEVFGTPLKADSRRFCWDPWSIPGQYRLLRTPAESFFPKSLFTPFLDRLLTWGRSQLGCQMISHPWLSAYQDGCFQNLHSDVPHGPFSFVFSLTPWKQRKFQGGETLISKPTLLRYFAEMDSGQSHEERDLITALPPAFNQLTVFDPRFPHGVRQVNGVETILDSRLVIHGWFTDPRPMLEGALPLKKILKPMDAFAEGILGTLGSHQLYSGLLTLRVHIKESGDIGGVEILVANLLDSIGRPAPRKLLNQAILQTAFSGERIRFPRSTGKTMITLPLLFQR